MQTRNLSQTVKSKSKFNALESVVTRLYFLANNPRLDGRNRFEQLSGLGERTDNFALRQLAVISPYLQLAAGPAQSRSNGDKETAHLSLHDPFQFTIPFPSIQIVNDQDFTTFT